MRTYIIILPSIPSDECDLNFSNFLTENKFEWWRYTALNWILATPDSVSTNFLMAKTTQIYNVPFLCVLEVDIKDVGGFFPMSKEAVEQAPKGWSPFNWFYQIKDPKYVKNWERKESSTTQETS